MTFQALKTITGAELDLTILGLSAISQSQGFIFASVASYKRQLLWEEEQQNTTCFVPFGFYGFIKKTECIWIT